VKERIDPRECEHAGYEEARADEAADCSALLFDATRKWPYPSVSLPRKEFMENA
jgi:hypothetical protein